MRTDAHRLRVEVGIGPLEQAARIAVTTCKTFLEENPDIGIEIIFCCFDENIKDAYQLSYNLRDLKKRSEVYFIFIYKKKS